MNCLPATTTDEAYEILWVSNAGLPGPGALLPAGPGQVQRRDPSGLLGLRGLDGPGLPHGRRQADGPHAAHHHLRQPVRRVPTQGHPRDGAPRRLPARALPELEPRRRPRDAEPDGDLALPRDAGLRRPEPPLRHHRGRLERLELPGWLRHRLGWRLRLRSGRRPGRPGEQEQRRWHLDLPVDDQRRGRLGPCLRRQGSRPSGARARARRGRRLRHLAERQRRGQPAAPDRLWRPALLQQLRRGRPGLRRLRPGHGQHVPELLRHQRLGVAPGLPARLRARRLLEPASTRCPRAGGTATTTRSTGATSPRTTTPGPGSPTWTTRSRRSAPTTPTASARRTCRAVPRLAGDGAEPLNTWVAVD